MKLYAIRGGNKEDLEQKRYTIGVGISLGNKWFSIENIVELVAWSLQYSKDKVIVYVADSIHAINLAARNGIPYAKALAKANKQGDEILATIREAVERRFSPEEVVRIMYVTWDEIADEKYREKVAFLKSLYSTDADFQNSITAIVRNFTQKEDRVFSEEKILRLGEYILEELPEVLCRVLMRGIVCDAYTYPTDGELTMLVEQIQKGDKFPIIKEKLLDTEPKVFLEVR